MQVDIVDVTHRDELPIRVQYELNGSPNKDNADIEGATAY